MHELWMLLRHLLLGLAIAALLRVSGVTKKTGYSFGLVIAALATVITLTMNSGEVTVYSLLAVCLVLCPVVAIQHQRRNQATENVRNDLGRFVTAFAVALLGFFALSAYPPPGP